MERGAGSGKYENCILTLAVMALNVFFMGLFFDFYYDLNDDMLMHDIMAGVYTGTPDGHNMQTLYPLGALIALCYRMCRTVPWYGLFLCLCQFGSLYLVGVRLCSMCDDTVRDGGAVPVKRDSRFADKLPRLLLLSLFQWGIWLSHLVNVQYTVTCAMLAAAAVFLFVTTPDGLEIQQFVAKNIPSVLLTLLAYMLRTEMLLLGFPFICLAGLYRLTAERRIWVRENLIKYGAALGSILAGMLLLQMADHVAYGSAAWQDFRRLFEARTTIYDYYPELVTDDRYGEELTRLGVAPSQQGLFRSYNFGLDEEIDTELFVKMAEYAKTVVGGSRDRGAIAEKSIARYLFRTTHGGVGGDVPYNVIVLWAYGAVFVTGCLLCVRDNVSDGQERPSLIRRFAFVWQLILLAFVRSALWLFILLRGRDPERITHSLYLIEFSLLAAMFVRMCHDFGEAARGKRGGPVRGMAFLFAVIAAFGVADSVRTVQADQEERVRVNAAWYAIDAYCREHKESFYFEDVYSTVQFSRRMFERSDNGCANYDVMGGWICKSPLYYEKLAHYDIDAADTALLDRGDVYLIMERSGTADGGIQTVTDYYRAQGIGVKAERADEICDGYPVWRFTQTE